MPITAPTLVFPEIDAVQRLLQFHPEKALISLGEQRVVLLHTKTWGSLRNELIAALGIHTTRALLTRIGFSSGTRDAELALQVRTPKEVIFNLIARGGQLQALEGIALVKPLRTEIDVEAGYCFLEFLWENSFEDDIHIAAYDIGTSPACWLEMGYASGFLSACMGKQILAREIECRAMGNDVCRVIAQPAERWPDPEVDLQYLEMPVAGRPVSYAANDTAATPGKGTMPSPFPEPRANALAQSKRASEVIGLSPAFQIVSQKIGQVAPTPATVLLLGESGVGKSAFARLVHEQSPRADGPFIAINCAAIPETLMESELFGVERGAFTGADVSRAGRFELAEGGTLFLDEIGTLPLIAQSKLLRVLETGQFERLGNGSSRHANVRIVAATNEELWSAVRAKRFREDLFFRLNVFPIEIPPLRNRKEDIPLLLEHFMRRFSTAYAKNIKGLTPEAIAMLLSYAWPGNIRELSNVIERAVILCEDHRPLDLFHLLTLKDLSRPSEHLRVTGAQPDGRHAATQPHRASEHTEVPDLGMLVHRLIHQPGLKLADIEARLVCATIEHTAGNISRAAAMLGITRGQLSYKLKKIG